MAKQGGGGYKGNQERDQDGNTACCAVPKRLWDFCGEWVAAVRQQLTAHDLPALQGRAPCEAIEGNTPGISEYAHFDWYQYVWYINPAAQFPEDSRKLDWWIGVAHDIGSPMTFWIHPQSCKALARSTVTSLTDDEMSDPIVRTRMAEFDFLSIKEKMGDMLVDDDIDKELVNLFPNIPDGIILPDLMDALVKAEAVMPDEADKYTPEAYNGYMMAEVLLPNLGNVFNKAKVTGRKRDTDGNPIGKQHSNPILDTREYVIELTTCSQRILLLRTYIRKLMMKEILTQS